MAHTAADFIAVRLRTHGVRRFFTVPGDFIMPLLDALYATEGLEMTAGTSELGVGYACDGYARESKSIGCLVVTWGVGALSALNAVAGMFSEKVGAVVFVGRPNPDPTHPLVHHSVGQHFEQKRCFEAITARQYSILTQDQLPTKIEEALLSAAATSKPVLVEISCNLFKVPLVSNGHSWGHISAPLLHATPMCEISANMSVSAIVKALEGSKRPIIIVGSGVTQVDVLNICQVASAIGCPMTCMADAKGLLNEEHPLFVGTYWSSLSSPNVEAIVDESDMKVWLQCRLNDFTTCGFTMLESKENTVIIRDENVTIGTTVNFFSVPAHEVLSKLASVAAAGQLPSRDKGMVDLQRLKHACLKTFPEASADESPLRLVDIQREVQRYLIAKPNSCLVDTGDVMLWAPSLHLCEGTSFYSQMQYASIGWSVGAALGCAQAISDDACCSNSDKHWATRSGGRTAGDKDTNGSTLEPPVLPDKDVLCIVGDGALQEVASTLSDFVKYDVKATVLLVNNDGYAVETKIHDGEYNRLQMWDYAGLANIFNGPRGGGRTTKAIGITVTDSSKLQGALAVARNHPGLCLIECKIAADDVSEQLMCFGPRLAQYTFRQCSITP